MFQINLINISILNTSELRLTIVRYFLAWCVKIVKMNNDRKSYAYLQRPLINCPYTARLRSSQFLGVISHSSLHSSDTKAFLGLFFERAIENYMFLSLEAWIICIAYLLSGLLKWIIKTSLLKKLSFVYYAKRIVFFLIL